jgi:hypothetical protein
MLVILAGIVTVIRSVQPLKIVFPKDGDAVFEAAAVGLERVKGIEPS